MSVLSGKGAKIGVLADDLTGALDAGLQAWRRGASVRVMIARGGPSAGFPPVRPGADVMVLDTESRSAAVAACRERIGVALDALREAVLPLRYKKIDSTLRGNIGGEIEVVVEAGAATSILLVPSLPAAGRAVRGGVHYVRGVPLAETEAARDPLWPMAGSEVAGIVAAQSGLPLALLPLGLVRGPSRTLLDAVEAAVAGGARVLVADAETDDDLRALSEVCRGSGGQPLACGSAGLFAHLDLGLGAAEPRPPERTRRWAAGRPVLVVSGSMSEVTREQIGVALRLPGAEHVGFEAAALFGTPRLARAEIERAADAVERSIARGATTILDGASMSRAELHAASSGDAAERQRRARLTLEAVAGAFDRVAPSIGGLVLAGGDTALAICRRAEAEGIDLAGEVEPLVPLGVLAGGSLDGLPVVSKAGALGSPAALAKAVAVLAGGRPA